MDNAQSTRNRRTATEIVDAIYSALSDQTFRNVAEISKIADLDWKTADRYTKLIIHIQTKHYKHPSWLLTETIGNATGYKKVPERGRPKK